VWCGPWRVGGIWIVVVGLVVVGLVVVVVGLVERGRGADERWERRRDELGERR
jgi:hypothetical protein